MGHVWVLVRPSRGRPENVLGASRINLPGTSLERHIRMSPGRHFSTSSGRQIKTSLGQSNRIFRRRPGDVGWGRPRDVLRTNICRLGIHCNIVNNDYQQDSRVGYKLVPSKSLGQLLNILPNNFVFLKPFNSDSSYIEVLFTDQNSKPPEIEDKINVTLVIN